MYQTGKVPHPILTDGFPKGRKMIRGHGSSLAARAKQIRWGGALCLALSAGTLTADDAAPAVAAPAAAAAKPAAAKAAAPAAAAKAPELSPEFAQPNLRSTLGDFLTNRPVAERIRIRKTDELLRPPFAKQPVDSPKGLAAKIRADELDVCNRVKATQYLGTVDCKAYPEAQEVLIKTMHEDKYELVRLAAAQALGVMLSRCSEEDRIMMCDPNYTPTDDCPMKKNGKYQAPWEKSKKRFLSGRDACRGCCNPTVLNALAKTAYDINDEGCCFEPSARVQQAAANSLAVCGICCREQADPWMEEFTPEPDPMNGGGGEKPLVPGGGEKDLPKQGEQDLPGKDGEKPADPTPATQNGVPPLEVGFLPHPAPATAPVHLPELTALNGYCIVGLRSKEFHKTQAEFWSIHDSRIYYFSSAAAKATFDAQPVAYSVDFCGSDPIEYLKTGQGTEGRFLRLVGDRLYLFATKENFEKFRSNPAGYTTQLQQALAQKVAQNSEGHARTSDRRLVKQALTQKVAQNQ